MCVCKGWVIFGLLYERSIRTCLGLPLVLGKTIKPAPNHLQFQCYIWKALKCWLLWQTTINMHRKSHTTLSEGDFRNSSNSLFTKLDPSVFCNLLTEASDSVVGGSPQSLERMERKKVTEYTLYSHTLTLPHATLGLHILWSTGMQQKQKVY